MFPSDAYGKESSERKMNKESCGSEVFVVNSEHDVILYLAIEISPLVFFPKKRPHQSSGLEECRTSLDLAGHAALAGRLHTCTYTCSLTLVHKHTQNIFVCSKKKSPCRCCLLTEALGKVYSGRKMNQNGLQVKSVMLFSTRPLDLFSPSLFPKKFFHIDAAHMRNCAELFWIWQIVWMVSMVA